MDQQSWENSRAIPESFTQNSSFMYHHNGTLFEVDNSGSLTANLGFHDMEYLDLDNSHNVAGTSSRMAVYRHAAVADDENVIIPVWNAASMAGGESEEAAAVPTETDGPDARGDAGSSSSQEDGTDFYDQFEDESADKNDTSRTSVNSSHQNSNAFGHDPLDGMDDFRALLEAAENDEILNNPNSRCGTKKNSSKSKKRHSSSRRCKKAKVKDHELNRLVSECLPSLGDSSMGIVPKYRAKNRLRSIIKRKPGTQDTDLMSSNVEILGGRVDKQTLSWLRQNFEEQAGQIMRREFLYERYLEFCQMTGREAMNAACVGKVVRTVFQGLSTRRLGRRGGSKYHYVNLQVVESSPFAAMRQSLGNAQKTGRKTKKIQKASANSSWNDSIKVQDEATLEETSSVANLASARVWAKNQKKLEAVELDFVTSGLSDEERSRRNILQLATNCLTEVRTNPDDLILIPEELSQEENWVELNYHITDREITYDDLKNFLRCFRLHVGMLGGLLVRLNFHCVTNICNNFWQFQEPSLQVSRCLSKEMFIRILEQDAVVEFIRRTLYVLFERIFNFYFSSKYTPVPDHLRAVFRDVTAKFDKWMVSASDGLPMGVSQILISTVFGFNRVVESVLDLSADVEHLSLLDKSKSSRPAFVTAVDSVIINGCMMPANISQEDRMSVTAFLLKLRDLSDSRTMADHWDYFVIDHLQQRSAVVDLVDTEDSLFKCQLIRQKILDNFGSAWCRAVLELEGAVRFPGFIGSGPYHGVIRFLRDSVVYSIECEKARIWRKSLIALNAEAISHSIAGVLESNNITCDSNLDHYIQCGIPIPLINSHSFDFFQSIPELAPLLKVDLVDPAITSIASILDEEMLFPSDLLDVRLPDLPLASQEQDVADIVHRPAPRSKRSRCSRTASTR